MYEGPNELPDVGDWRYQEMLRLDPYPVMDELLELANSLLDARTEYDEAASELRDAQQRLEYAETYALQAALDSEDDGVRATVEGKNAEVRSRKASLFLADSETIVEMREEVWQAAGLADEKRVAMDTLLDRQKNLHSWSRMFEAIVRLLATVQPAPSVGFQVPEVEYVLVEQDTLEGNGLPLEKGLVEPLGESGQGQTATVGGEPVPEEVQEAMARYEPEYYADESTDVTL